MKISSPKIIWALLAGMLLIRSISYAQVIDNEDGISITNKRSFEIGMFMEANWKINLILAIHRPKQIMVTLKNAKNGIIHREYLKKTQKGYRQKFDFAGADSGVYQLEVSDGWKTVVRQIEVVNLPAIDSQRYIIYGSQTGM